VRLLAYAAFALALAVAGCGSEVEVDLVWSGPPEPGADGAASVQGFRGYQEQVDEHWERSAVMAATEYLRLDERTAARISVDGEAETGEGTGSQVVVVTLDGLPDDSVRAERWLLTFDEQDGTYLLRSALRQLRCQPGRGHQAFTPDDCV
jgi:hypothetical protein